MNARESANVLYDPKSSEALIDFVLGHMSVAWTNGSRQQCEDASFACKRRVLGVDNLIFVTRGTVGWTLGDTTHELNAGCLLLSPAGVPHRGESRSLQITLLSMHLSATLPGGQDALSLVKPPAVQRVPPSSLLERYLIATLDEYQRDDPLAIRQAMPHHAGLVTLEILRHSAARGLVVVPPFDPLVTRILEELDRRIGVPTTLSELADLSGYSAQHLGRLFKRTLGLTPLQHLTHLRMRYAADLLLTTNATLDQIADRIAIEDPYYFSRLFKKHTGQSPSQYRAGSDSFSLSRGSSGPLE